MGQQAAEPYSRSWGLPTIKYHLTPNRVHNMPLKYNETGPMVYKVRTRLNPGTNENRRKRTAQLIGPPCHGVTVENGSNRVLRGGCWINDASNCRAAYRNDNHPDNRDNNVGFRLLSSLLRPKCIVYE